LHNFTHGHILYVHTLVNKPNCNGTLWKIVKTLRERELECDTVAFRSARNNQWVYKIERRREKMRDNCGILAFDNLMKGMNKRANQMSMDSLSRIARDNGILLFPMKVPKDEMKKIEYPFIIHTNNHFELIEEPVALEGLSLDKDVHILSPKAISTYIMSLEESKNVRGAGEGDTGIFGRKGAIGQYFSKPARLIPLGVSALGGAMGMPATVTTPLSTIAGLGQAATTGLYGEQGAARSLLRGGLSGLGTGAIGRGLGTGYTAMKGAGPGFLAGFREGFGSAIPFGERLGVYTPQYAQGMPGFGFGVQPAWQNLTQPWQWTPRGTPGLEIFPGTGGMQFALREPTAPAVDLGTIDVTKPAAELAVAGGQQPPPGGPVPVPTEEPGARGILSRLGEFFGIGPREAVAEGAAGPTRWTDYLPSAAFMLGGQMLPQPEYDVPSIQQTFAQMQQQGIPTVFTPEGELARQEIMRNIQDPESILNLQTTEYKGAIAADIARREEQELAFIGAKHADNGTWGGSDYFRDVQATQEKYRNETLLRMGEIEQNLYNQRVSIYLDSVSAAYQMDRANLEVIAGLTQATVAEAAFKYGLKAQEVKDFRDALYAMAAASFPGTQNYGQA
jgi:hypothetical protein